MLTGGDDGVAWRSDVQAHCGSLPPSPDGGESSQPSHPSPIFHPHVLHLLLHLLHHCFWWHKPLADMCHDQGQESSQLNSDHIALQIHPGCTQSSFPHHHSSSSSSTGQMDGWTFFVHLQQREAPDLQILPRRSSASAPSILTN